MLASSAVGPGFNPQSWTASSIAKDVIKMVPVVPLFSTQHEKGKYWLFLKNKDRTKNVMDKILDRNPSKSEVIGGDKKKRMITQNRQKSNAKKYTKKTPLQIDKISTY